jgi:hypothetical protein
MIARQLIASVLGDAIGELIPGRVYVVGTKLNEV